MTHTQRLAQLRTHNWHEIPAFSNMYQHKDDHGKSHACAWIEGPIGVAERSAYMLTTTGRIMLHGTMDDYEFEDFIALLTAKPEIVIAPVQTDRQRSLFD